MHFLEENIDSFIQSLFKLGINQLSAQSVDEVFNSQFTESSDALANEISEFCIENELSHTAIRLCMQKILESLGAVNCSNTDQSVDNHHGNIDAENGERNQDIWASLRENDIQHNNIIAWLHIKIYDSKDSNGLRNWINALQASHIYILLLSLPGSSALQILHPMIFDSVANIVNKWLMYETNSGTTNSNQDDSGDYDDEDVSQNQNDKGALNAQERQEIDRAVWLLSKDLIALVKKSAFDPDSEYFAIAAQTFVSTLKNKKEDVVIDFNISDPYSSRVKSYRQLFVLGLDFLCECKFKEKALNKIYSMLLPIITMVPATKQVPSKHTISIQEDALNFACSIFVKDEPVAAPAIRILMQHLCLKCPDKVEYRSRVAQSVVKLIQLFPVDQQNQFYEWLHRLSQYQKATGRLMSLEVASILIAPLESELAKAMQTKNCEETLNGHLFAIFVDRLVDVSSSVRSKALQVVAKCLASPQHLSLYLSSLRSSSSSSESNIQSEASEINQLSSLHGQSSSNRGSSSSKSLLGQFHSINLKSPSTPNLNIIHLQNLLKQRVCDPKVNVRKAAVMALGTLFKIEVAAEQIELISGACSDVALSVRKQAMQSLTEILMAWPRDEFIQKQWLHAVLYMILDRESSIQERCVKLVTEVIFSQLVCASDDLSWKLLDILVRKENFEDRRLFQKVVISWSCSGIDRTFIERIVRHLDGDEVAAVLMLLSMIKNLPAKVGGFSLMWRCWDLFDRLSVRSWLFKFTVFHPELVSNDIRQAIIAKLEDWQTNCALSDEESQQFICTIGTVIRCNVDLKDQQMELAARLLPLLTDCDNILSSAIRTSDSVDDQALSKCLLLVGELTLLCPRAVPQTSVLAVQAILAGPNVQAVEGGQVLSQFRSSQRSSKIRAKAIVALGRMCIVNEKLAKKCIPAFARELDICRDPAVRSNCMLVMGDLCMRFTSVVDSYTDHMSLCLKDRCALVRKQTLTVLTNLLQEDFLKWKGSLFYHFLSVLIDDDARIVAYAESCLLRLVHRQKELFSTHFIESIFFFNAYEMHPGYNKFFKLEKSTNLFKLTGLSNKRKRVYLYKFMLSKMNDQQRFNLISKISHDILLGMVEEVFHIDDASSMLIKDTFQILTFDEIKLSSLKRAIVPADDDDQAAIATLAAQQNFLAGVVRKQMQENIIPTVISLKKVLQRKKPSLIQDLMKFLVQVMTDYKDQLKEFLAGEPHLAAEIEYDIRKYEEKQSEESDAVQNPLTPFRSPLAHVSMMHDRKAASPMSNSPRQYTKSPGNCESRVIVRPLHSQSPCQNNAISKVLNSHPAISPANRALQSPATPKTPIPSSSGNQSLAKKVLINSAKKALKSSKKTTKHSLLHRKLSNRQKVLQMRAISTPSTTMSEITFLAQDMSILPPSPIENSAQGLSRRQRLHSEVSNPLTMPSLETE